MRFYLLLMIGFLFGGLTRAGQEATRFQLYYGSAEEEWQQLEAAAGKGSLIVVDHRAFEELTLEEWVGKLQRKKARVLAYISVGELHSREMPAFKALLPGEKEDEIDELILDHNEVFDSYRVDVSHLVWSQWIEQKLEKIYKLGFDGVFLDTVDTVDHYASNKEWELERRSKSVSAMIELISYIKRINPKKYVLQNGGLNMVGEKMFVGDAKGILVPGQHLAKYASHNPDGILWENAYAGKDDWTMAKLKKLINIQAANNTDVFALGYQQAHATPEELAEQCKKHDFIGAWAVSTEVLHEAATRVVE